MDALAQLYTTLTPYIPPLVYYGKPFTRTSKPLWVSLIGPSGAGKGVIGEALFHTGKFYRVITATNRPMRAKESSSAYVWMRARLPGEPETPYIRTLVKEHHLIEYNYHYGNLYGTPMTSLLSAARSRKIPLYESENKGALFMEKVLSDVWNVLTIMIVPDDIQDIEQRILTGGRNNATQRLQESLTSIKAAASVAHFIVKNPSTSVESGKTGLQSAITAVKGLIENTIR